MNEFLSFRKFLTPVIIQMLFWLGAVICFIGGLVALVGGSWAGLLVMVIGPLGVRIYCELLIVVFRMSDFLNRIAKNTSREQVAAAVPAEAAY